MMGGPGHAPPPPPKPKKEAKSYSGDRARQLKRDRARESYHATHPMWTRCPTCEHFLPWFYQHGLKGQVCKCGYEFTGRERNPIIRRCTIGDGVIHATWVQTQQKTVAYLRCELDTAWQTFHAKPLPADTQVTCLMCLATMED